MQSPERERYARLAHIMPILQNNVWHRTSHSGAIGIYQDGFIRPNLGEFSFTYPQSEYYYGGRNGYVCLFDFETANEDDYCDNVDVWAPFLTDQEPVTFLLGLDRKQLPALITYESIPKSEMKCIGFVECWYPEPIPFSAVDQLLITRWDPVQFNVEILFQGKLTNLSPELTAIIFGTWIGQEPGISSAFGI
jgi:hypothetical protein